MHLVYNEIVNVLEMFILLTYLGLLPSRGLRPSTRVGEMFMYTFNILNESAFQSTTNKLGISVVVKGQSKSLDMLHRLTICCQLPPTSFILMNLV